MASKHDRTRNDTSCNMSKYLGSGKQMCATELPTLMDCLRYCLLLRETSVDIVKIKSISEFVIDIVEQIKVNWHRANAKFQAPVIVNDRWIETRLSFYWERCSKIARGKASSQEKKKFEDDLDKLFDNSKCKCPLISCEEAGVFCKGYHCED